MPKEKLLYNLVAKEDKRNERKKRQTDYNALQGVSVTDALLLVTRG